MVHEKVEDMTNLVHGTVKTLNEAMEQLCREVDVVRLKEEERTSALDKLIHDGKKSR